MIRVIRLGLFGNLYGAFVCLFTSQDFSQCVRRSMRTTCVPFRFVLVVCGRADSSFGLVSYEFDSSDAMVSMT